MLPTLFNSSNYIRDFPTLLDDLFFLDVPRAIKKAYVLPLDVEEGEDTYKVSLDAPGLNKEDIDISVDSNVLTVSINKQEEVKSNKYLLRERKFVKTSRSISLPKNIDSGNISASLSNGVLNIVLNKDKKESTKKINIQ